MKKTSPRATILQATLECIVAHGIDGTSLRIVADKAGVSLGSLGYYFQDKDGLLGAAFMSFVEASATEFAQYYEGVDTLEAAREATAQMLIDTASNRTSIILGSELYNLSLRRPRHRIILDEWTKRCRAVMATYFDEDTTFILDAFYEGVILHRSMRLGEYADDRIRTAIERLTPPESFAVAAS